MLLDLFRFDRSTLPSSAVIVLELGNGNRSVSMEICLHLLLRWATATAAACSGAKRCAIHFVVVCTLYEQFMWSLAVAKTYYGLTYDTVETRFEPGDSTNSVSLLGSAKDQCADAFIASVIAEFRQATQAIQQALQADSTLHEYRRMWNAGLAPAFVLITSRQEYRDVVSCLRRNCSPVMIHSMYVDRKTAMRPLAELCYNGRNLIRVIGVSPEISLFPPVPGILAVIAGRHKVAHVWDKQLGRYMPTRVPLSQLEMQLRIDRFAPGTFDLDPPRYFCYRDYSSNPMISPHHPSTSSDLNHLVFQILSFWPQEVLCGPFTESQLDKRRVAESLRQLCEMGCIEPSENKSGYAVVPGFREAINTPLSILHSFEAAHLLTLVPRNASAEFQKTMFRLAAILAYGADNFLVWLTPVDRMKPVFEATEPTGCAEMLAWRGSIWLAIKLYDGAAPVSPAVLPARLDWFNNSVRIELESFWTVHRTVLNLDAAGEFAASGPLQGEFPRDEFQRALDDEFLVRVFLFQLLQRPTKGYPVVWTDMLSGKVVNAKSYDLGPEDLEGDCYFALHFGLESGSDTGEDLVASARNVTLVRMAAVNAVFDELNERRLRHGLPTLALLDLIASKRSHDHS